MRNVNLGICEKSDRKIVRLESIEYDDGWDFVALTEEQYKFLEYLMEKFHLEDYLDVSLSPTAIEI